MIDMSHINTLVNDTQKEMLLLLSNPKPTQEAAVEEAIEKLDEWRDKHLARIRRAFNG